MSAENVELEEQLSLFEDEEIETPTQEEGDSEFSDELREYIIKEMRKVSNDGMIVGFQTACHTALNKIYAFERSAGKKSANDYKRCIKDLKKFFETGISRRVNANDEPVSEENAEAEAVQN